MWASPPTTPWPTGVSAPCGRWPGRALEAEVPLELQILVLPPGIHSNASVARSGWSDLSDSAAKVLVEAAGPGERDATGANPGIVVAGDG